jgi:pimeloyl-ACP methyl ester carboxylesterase
MTRWSLRGIACALLLVLVPAAPAADQYFDSAGVKIRYIEAGKGEPVLLIHGFGASVELQWVLPGVYGALAKRYHVIAYDNRGHGKSGKPRDPKDYGMNLVEDAVRLLDHLKIKKAHVVGYSMGAMIAAKLLVTHPDRLRTATLGGAGPFVDDKALLAFTNQLADNLEQGKGIGPLIDALWAPGKPRPSAEQVKAFSQAFSAFNDTKALAAVVRSWKAIAVPDADLKANRVPTLALVGADDPLKKGVETLPARMSDVKLVILPDADHMTAFTRSQFLQTLETFLADHGARAKPKAPQPVPAGTGG